MIVLIPAYEPDAALIEVIRSIRTADPDLGVVVVDDGSGDEYDGTFHRVGELGAEVVRYGRNRGKGHALKTGFGYIAARYPGHDVVCADCDGQHTVADILRVADRVPSTSAAMVLGTRNFSGEVPLRSRLGNTASRVLFRLATGNSLSDTQTGLRAYPGSMLGWLQSIPGERYEYELNLLLQAADAGIGIETVQIDTVYLNENESSHFRPVADSVRIYAPLLTFALSSVAAFAIDMTALLVLSALTGSLLVSVVGARMLSSLVNFLTNRRLVFEHGRDKPTLAAAAQYFALVVGLLTINYLSLMAFQAVGFPLLPAKLITELGLFAVSYAVQRRFVFARVGGRPAAAPARLPVGVGILTVGQRERVGE